MLNEKQERLCTASRWVLIKDAGGIPAYGNQRAEWDAGCRFDHPNPLYR